MDQKSKFSLEQSNKKPGDFPAQKKKLDQKGSQKEGYSLNGSLKGHHSRGRG
jgi:hypothetical protein